MISQGLHVFLKRIQTNVEEGYLMGKKGRNTQAKKPLNGEPKQRNQNFKGEGNPKLEGENRPAT